MFAKLTGIVDLVLEDRIILDVNNVGYKIFLSKKDLNNINLVKKEPISFYIETIVREDNISLYGFSNIEYQNFFNMLCKINGISNKIAIKILGIADISDIIGAVNAEDKNIFTNIPGIGPKLASRILVELKDQIKKIDFYTISSINKSNQSISMSNSQIMQDAISALENLGYKRATIYKIATNHINANPEITLETLITNCLREL